MAKRAKASAKKRVKPFGNQWSMATHTENVSPKELGRRAQAAMAQTPGTSS